MKILTSICSGLLLLSATHGEEGRKPGQHKLLQAAVDHSNPESVARHFLRALGNGDRKQAEGIMVPDKGFWNGVTEKEFPFGANQSAALLEAANGGAENSPDSITEENMTHLTIGSIPLTLSKSREIKQWKVFTGYLFSTRHVNGITLPLHLNKAIQEKRKPTR